MKIVEQNKLEHMFVVFIAEQYCIATLALLSNQNNKRLPSLFSPKHFTKKYFKKKF